MSDVPAVGERSARSSVAPADRLLRLRRRLDRLNLAQDELETYRSTPPEDRWGEQSHWHMCVIHLYAAVETRDDDDLRLPSSDAYPWLAALRHGICHRVTLVELYGSARGSDDDLPHILPPDERDLARVRACIREFRGAVLDALSQDGVAVAASV